MTNLKMLLALTMTLAAPLRARSPEANIAGRWDITVHDKSGDSPSWLEVSVMGKIFVGRFLGTAGSARPISEIRVEGKNFSFQIPEPWNDSRLKLKGSLANDKITGTINSVAFDAVRAPAPKYVRKYSMQEPIRLFDGNSLKGWKVQTADNKNNWTVKDGVMVNTKAGANIVTEQKFKDFNVHAEFRYPKGGNSGFYLRGRYEAQILDSYGAPADSHGLGGIYGFLVPKINVSKQPDEWQSYDITLVDRFVSVVLNGETVITEQEIPGITGGALDSHENESGPFMIQGDHGAVEFRNIVVTPIAVQKASL